MKKSTNIVMIGAGNVAHHLLHSFVSIEQIHVAQVYNHRKSAQAKQLAHTYNCSFVNQYHQMQTDADIYFICVKDDAIADVVKHLKLLKLQGLVVHTSGSVDISALKTASPKTGVYYPLQSFSINNVIQWKQTPVLIEANSKQSFGILSSIAKNVSDIVKQVDSSKRLKLHLAAVFACNFTNALYGAAFQLMEQSFGKKETQLLMPLMEQSFYKLQSMPPKLAQTGPAMRHDVTIMNKHLALLKSNKQLATIYKLLSELIMAQQAKHAKL